MRSPIVRALAALVLALPPVALPAAAAAAPRPTSYAAAPAQVRRDLMKIFAECGTEPAVVRATARLHVAPVGGRGHRDYLFSFDKTDWPREYKAEDYPGGGRCTANASWTVLWMDVGGGRYQQLLLPNGAVASKGDDYAVLQTGCDAAAPATVSSRAWVLTWDARHRTFESVTGCGSVDDAAGWLKAHGYG